MTTNMRPCVHAPHIDTFNTPNTHSSPHMLPPNTPQRLPTHMDKSPCIHLPPIHVPVSTTPENNDHWLTCPGQTPHFRRQSSSPSEHPVFSATALPAHNTRAPQHTPPAPLAPPTPPLHVALMLKPSTRDPTPYILQPSPVCT